MKSMKIPPYIRSSNIALANWQSAVANTVRNRIKANNPGLNLNEVNRQVFADPMVLGTNLHVARHKKSAPELTYEDIKPFLSTTGDTNAVHPVVHSYLSEYYFKQAVAMKVAQDTSTPSPPSGFPDSDQASIAWLKAADEWSSQHQPQTYIDWTVVAPGEESTFSVIDIPENSKIVILGDFGTGLPDATIMLMAIINQLQPDFIIHLGDIYYAGQQAECEAYAAAFTTAFGILGPVPVFSIPGNHEYYSGGSWFYQYAMTLNANSGVAANLQQQASYFCLRTADNNWQFLGMDTGMNSVQGSVAYDILPSFAYAPWLWFTEQQWHEYQLQNFTGQTILLSHHQLYSASAVINADNDVCYLTNTDPSSLTYVNGNLLNVFSPYFTAQPNQSQVAAWFWGHEHILGVFENGQNGLQVGRLVGNSGYEEWEYDSDAPGMTGPYSIPSDSTIQYSTSPPVEVGQTSVPWGTSNYNFFQHGFACVQLNGASATVNYYEYPVMSQSAPIPTTQAEVDALQTLAELTVSDTL